MSVLHGYVCPRCRSTLVIASKVRPVCRVAGCGAQMRPVHQRIPRVNRFVTQEYNRLHGTKPGEKL